MTGSTDNAIQEKSLSDNHVSDPTLEDLAGALTDICGQPITPRDITALGDAAHKYDVADATLKYRVTLPDGGAGFLIAAGYGNPELLDRALANIATARDKVSPSVAAPILPPILNGHAAGRSFALWPARPEFRVTGRIGRLMRYHRYGSDICQWLIALGQETLQPALTETFIENLRAILDEPAFAGPMHTVATQAMNRIESGDWAPRHCLQHGDFWVGNVLLSENGEETPFHVIDWAGMNPLGYPFMDMCRILLSLNCSHRFAARQMAKLQAQVECAPEDMQGYVLSGFGYTGQNLEHFPPDRFRAKAQSIFRFISKF